MKTFPIKSNKGLPVIAEGVDDCPAGPALSSVYLMKSKTPEILRPISSMPNTKQIIFP